MATRKTYRKAFRTTSPRRRNWGRNIRQWTREEIHFMRQYYRQFETAWIARQLGRSVYSVRYKAVDLNLKKANPSIWRGNVGKPNAFRGHYRPTTSRCQTTRTTWRRTNRSRSFRAWGRRIRRNKRW